MFFDSLTLARNEHFALEDVTLDHLQFVGKIVSIEIVQKPASWATANLRTPTVKPGAAASLDISVDGPFVPAKDTSVTLDAGQIRFQNDTIAGGFHSPRQMFYRGSKTKSYPVAGFCQC